MSGGVDSSVAALLLKREGAELVGLSMHLWDHDRDGTGSAAGRCCTLDDLSVARRAAEAIGIPHYVLDLTERFEEAVDVLEGKACIRHRRLDCVRGEVEDADAGISRVRRATDSGDAYLRPREQ